MSEVDPSSAHVVAFMARVSAELNTTLSPPEDVTAFGDNPALKDELLGLLLQGKKTSTTNWPIPETLHWSVGDLSVILDGKGEPRAIIKTTSFERCKFRDVREDLALAEGEGTYQEWRDGHIRYFKRSEDSKEFSEDVEVLCEWFEVVYPQVTRK
ncbi:hypothetical protein CSAL01_01007 [Colletotrichum salicis]|uniref:ASCH domain-containing protein n=1 Tax=Colletotrichum salicis TaxID=1209931 RepID=A0A135UNM5_9PEZI|nr:hypothetical protein CSAL01_01007 [Colletotrichum salicis]